MVQNGLRIWSTTRPIQLHGLRCLNCGEIHDHLISTTAGIRANRLVSRVGGGKEAVMTIVGWLLFGGLTGWIASKIWARMRSRALCSISSSESSAP
jgi:hypothetical protein